MLSEYNCRTYYSFESFKREIVDDVRNQMIDQMITQDEIIVIEDFNSGKTIDFDVEPGPSLTLHFDDEMVFCRLKSDTRDFGSFESLADMRTNINAHLEMIKNACLVWSPENHRWWNRWTRHFMIEILYFLKRVKLENDVILDNDCCLYVLSFIYPRSIDLLLNNVVRR